MVATQVTLASAFARQRSRSARRAPSSAEAGPAAVPAATREHGHGTSARGAEPEDDHDAIEEADDGGAASSPAAGADAQSSALTDAGAALKRVRLQARKAAEETAAQAPTPAAVENLFSALAGFQTSGRLCTYGKRQAMRIACSSYCQLPPVLLDASWAHSGQPSTWEPQDTSRRLPGYRPPGCIAAMEVDSGGELLACAASCGRLRIYDFLSLRHESQVSAAHGVAYSKATPVVKVDSERRLSGVRWNKSNENVVGCVSDDDRTVALYDLQYCKNSPTTELEFPTQGGGLGWGGGDVGLRASLGLADLQFPEARSGCGALVAAAGQAGCAVLWDCRRGKRPSAVLSAPPRSGALHSLVLSRDGKTLCCGTEGGEIAAWDLRGGTAASKVQKFGAGGAYVHPLLFSCPLGPHLRCLVGAEYKGVIGRAVQCLAADPVDDQRLAFVLPSGAAGIYDCRRQCVTHFHDPAVRRAAPAQAGGAEDPAAAAGTEPPAGARGNLRPAAPPPQQAPAVSSRGCFARRRRGQWWGPGHGFAVGSPLGDELMLLDFRRAAGNMASPDRFMESCREATHLPVNTGSVVSAGAHPQSDELVVGSFEAMVALVRERPPIFCEAGHDCDDP